MKRGRGRSGVLFLSVLRYILASRATYPNAYPNDGDYADINRCHRSKSIENTSCTGIPFAYEPEGRMFEDCRGDFDRYAKLQGFFGI